ncbi:Epidermal growth factor receptor substrate 15 [Myotis davidii]|uniref:Epidermal growth factor receptor substrate 15 n=1 Tax=Myotis davidii TaxID=225400 RepID=L5LKE3_MYODS|nr:Epidermal growth factor receptor substrate 15 [Myotis davidii]
MAGPGYLSLGRPWVPGQPTSESCLHLGLALGSWGAEGTGRRHLVAVGTSILEGGAEFFVALRLVACAQNGLEVSLSNLNLAVPPPRFHDTSSPLLISGTSATELPWAVKSEDKAKYDAIFDSLSPVNGFLSGDKVKPVLLNSKLPVDILGRVWELSDIDHDGMLDRDEFAVAMFLVYCALEKEPVPMSLPPALVPPSKRKTVSISGSVRLIPTSAAKESYHSLPPVAILPTKVPLRQKLIKGIDPPHILTPEMIPPSDRASLQKNIIGSSPVADFSAIKELDTLNNELVDLQREKNNVEQDLKEKEDTLKQRTSEVQDLQDEVQRESTNLQNLQAQKQQVQELLDGLDEQKAQLEEQLQEVRKKCSEEAQLILSLKAELTSQESQISTYEEELAKAREELSRLQQETAELEESVESGKAQLGPLQQHLQDSQQELSSIQMKLMEMKELENHSNPLNWRSSPHSILVNGTTDYCSLSTSSSETANLNEHAEGQSNLESEPIHQESPVRSSPEIPPCGVTDEIEVVTPAVNEKVCPEFNSDRLSKEIHLEVILSKVQIHLPLTVSSNNLLLIPLSLLVLTLSVQPAIAVLLRLGDLVGCPTDGLSGQSDILSAAAEVGEDPATTAALTSHQPGFGLSSAPPWELTDHQEAAPALSVCSLVVIVHHSDQSFRRSVDLRIALLLYWIDGLRVHLLSLASPLPF